MRTRKTWLIGILVALALIFGPGFVQLLQMSYRQHLMDRRLRELEATHERLRAQHQRLESDPTYVEGLIRSTFKVAKPGELVVPLNAPDSSDQAR